ncbi:MAG: GAF domain-containing sensor histidine kinase [Desulfobacteraceae bacterium]|nr:GAF domain-containing sensor histidine kinase [Desulfobacteraceae bacterium]
MDLAKELVQQQMFFRRELSERVSWFIGLRWMAVVFALAGAWAAHLGKLVIPLAPITTVIAAITIYNLLFTIICRYLRRLSSDHERPFEICAHGQILCDLSALYALIYYTGGFYSPLTLFVLFHIILAGILLAPAYAYIYSGLNVAALGLLGYLQNTGAVAPYAAIFSHSMFNKSHTTGENITLFIILTTAMFITAFLVTTIKLSLRTKGRTLLVFCKELDIANAKLTALYQLVKQMAFCADYQELMDSATQAAARIMGVKASSIKLLDDQRKMLRFASTFGLSQNYLSKGDVEIAKSPINQKIIDGAYYSIGNIEEQDYFQYPENVRQEGIASMICLPLKVEKRVLGVFCVYSDARFYFSDKDVDFFALISELTALAMQNLKNELNKSWFLQKTAHQLRSPLNAVDGMLKVLRKSYAGPLNEKQTEMLAQCERRIEGLAYLIQDLLKLGVKRAGSGPAELRPMSLAPLLEQLSSVYHNQAKEKGVSLTLVLDRQLPPILGEPKIVDDLYTNLLSNAIKYTPAGRKVEVLLAKENAGWLSLRIIDQGIGIPQDQLPRLFTEFFRAENAKAFTDQGTGLGLVIAKEAMDRLRGTLHIDSQEGQGTRVTCKFPINSKES